MHRATSDPHNLPGWIAAFWPTLARSSASLKGKAASVVKTLQVGRMVSVLLQFSDAQLAEIRISRFDIARYAESLLAKDGEAQIAR